MALTGDKMKCKEIMKKAEVPTIPGSDDILEEVDKAVEIAQELDILFYLNLHTVAVAEVSGLQTMKRS